MGEPCRKEKCDCSCHRKSEESCHHERCHHEEHCHHEQRCHRQERCGHRARCHHEEGCHHDEKCGEFGHGFVEAANCAWMAVLVEKIKDHIRSTDNDRMTELAKIIAESNSERWKHKMRTKRHCKDFEEKLCHFFGTAKK
jgi:hypothetical protein